MSRRLWLLLHEPRIITALTALGWLVMLGIGLAALFAPPQTIRSEWGPTLTDAWGVILCIGASFGLAGCLSGWWWVERIGITLTLTGSAMYLATVVVLHITEPGNRLVQAGYVTFAAVMLLVRWQRIRGLQLDPARGR